MSTIKQVNTTAGHLAAQEHTSNAVSAGPVCTVESNRLEHNERDYAGRSSGVGQDLIKSGAQSLGEHQSMEVICKANVAVDGLAAKAEGKLKITRRDDGKYEVEVMNAFGVGVGDEHAKATVGVGAGTRYVVSTPEAAADIAQAIASLEVVAATSGSGVGPFVMAADAFTGTSRSAMERLSHYSDNLASVKCDLRGTVEVEPFAQQGPKKYSGAHLEAKAEGQGATELEVNLEKGEVCFIKRLDGKFEGEASIDLSPLGTIAEQVQNRFGGKGEARVGVRIESRCQIPPELKARVASGELSGTELAKTLAKLPMHQVVVAEVELEGRGAGLGTGAVRGKMTAEYALDDKAPADIARALLDTKWEFEAEAGLGGEAKVGGGGVGFEGSLMTWSATKHEVGSLRDLIDRAAGHFTEQHDMNATLHHAMRGAALAS